MRTHFIKLKVSRLISSFKSCRSKDPSTLPSNPIPTYKLFHFSVKRHVSSALLSARKSFSRPRTSHASSLSLSSPSSSHFKWEKHSKWHVLNYDSTPPRRKIYTSAASEDDLLPLPPPPKKKHTKRRRFSRYRRRYSTSSDSGVFSDDVSGDESETLISTDTSTPRHHYHRRGNVAGESVLGPTPARLSEFMRKMMPCKAESEVVEGKVRESYAVVKRSDDPYEDFRRSMAEMVVEKEMFEKEELEGLLRCFLELNSEHLHSVIVRAFVDLWETLFSKNDQ